MWTKQNVDRIKIRSGAAVAQVDFIWASASLAEAKRRRDGWRMGVGPHAN
jgi:hypothetical protein